MKISAYLRVSTADQTTENQRMAIESYCTSHNWPSPKIYSDEGISGAKHDRPALDQLKKACIQGKMDVLIVWKFDRLARSTSHLLETLELLQRNGCDFVSVTEAIDTTTPAGKMVLTFLGAVAEFERELIRERVMAGLDRAKANGQKLGRPRVGFDFSKAIELRQEGMGYKRISDLLKVPRSTIFRHLKGIPKTSLNP